MLYSTLADLIPSNFRRPTAINRLTTNGSKADFCEDQKDWMIAMKRKVCIVGCLCFVCLMMCVAAQVKSVSPPTFSLPEGFYDKPITLQISAENKDAKLYYTTDCSVPTQKSQLYTKPLKLKKTTVIRVRAFVSGIRPSAVMTGTYLIGEKKHLPVLSLVTAPANLWDQKKGIYRNSNRRGLQWERPVSAAYFKKDGTLGVAFSAGLRIHGGMSRVRSAKQSFRLYFRSKYGNDALEYPIIPSAPKGIRFYRLVLRGGYNDSWRHHSESQRRRAIYVRDQVVRDLHLDMGCVASHGDFVELYLNGKYWGLYNICERIDAKFLESYFNHADWDVIKDGSEVKEGDSAAWNKFRTWYYRADLSKEKNYQAIQRMLDLDNFTSYFILNIWTQNYDWPYHNWYAARKRGVPGVKPLRDAKVLRDAKWFFLAWDSEYAFGAGMQSFRVNQNTLAHASQRGQGPLAVLFSKLLRNPNYRSYFAQRLNEYQKGALDPAHVQARISARLEQVRPAIAAEARRWQPNKGIANWERAAKQAQRFVAKRAPYVRRHVKGIRNSEFGMRN